MRIQHESHFFEKPALLSPRVQNEAENLSTSSPKSGSLSRCSLGSRSFSLATGASASGMAIPPALLMESLSRLRLLWEGDPSESFSESESSGAASPAQLVRLLTEDLSYLSYIGIH